MNIKIKNLAIAGYRSFGKDPQYFDNYREEQFPNVVFEPILSCKCFFNSINKINAFKNLRNQLVAA